MSIQSDLQLSTKNGITNLVGLTDVCEESPVIDTIQTGTKQLKLARYALQFVFLGFSGFRFPIAHFPTDQVSASEIYLLFWKMVRMMSLYGFKVSYVSMDGAESNRDFMKILLRSFKSIDVTSMAVQNIYSISQQSIYLIMDYSHLMKKVRNNIFKSGNQQYCKRTLLCNGHYIFYEHWLHAYQWDISHNPFPIKN